MNLEIGEDILTISANLLKIELYSGLVSLDVESPIHKEDPGPKAVL